ncbi:MAG: hypothetical protein LBV43_11940 [Prevotella sp.]|jgi:uncharacterized protein (DUF2147 family)|nr:hypothetical protein [Prevotella sp.]
MKNLILGDGSRKAQEDLYGTWFAENGNAKYLISKCEERIDKYRKWLTNFEQLLTSVKEEQFKAREEEIRQFLSRCTPEEIAAFQNGSSV